MVIGVLEGSGMTLPDHGPLGVEHGRTDPPAWDALVARVAELRLTTCARCYRDAEDDKGRPMAGIPFDYTGEYPVAKLLRTLHDTNTLMIRLRICNECYREAMAYAAPGGVVDGAISAWSAEPGAPQGAGAQKSQSGNSPAEGGRGR